MNYKDTNKKLMTTHKTIQRIMSKILFS